VTSRGGPIGCCSSRTGSAFGCYQLSARLGDAEWLDGAFSAGDLTAYQRAFARQLSSTRGLPNT
jgi:hypothetical protein